jgi:hypothetical protein
VQALKLALPGLVRLSIGRDTVLGLHGA